MQQTILGKVRTEYVYQLQESGKKVIKEGMHLLWIIDFPLFEIDKDLGILVSAHHPFTAPNPLDAHLLQESPEKVY